MIEVGMKAPQFILPDKNGNIVSLSDSSERKWSCIFILKIILLVVQDKRALLRKKQGN